MYRLRFLKKISILLSLLVFLILVFLVVKERSKSRLADSEKVEVVKSGRTEIESNDQDMILPGIHQDQYNNIASDTELPNENKASNKEFISDEKLVVEQLKRETVYDSLNNLALEGRAFETVSPQFRFNSFEIKLPLKSDNRLLKNDLIMIVGNRRVAKLLEELDSLPKAESGRLLAQQIRKDLNLYRQKAEEYDILSRGDHDLELELDSEKGFLGFSVEETRLGDDPGLEYIRLSLLSQAFVAGVLELPEAAGAILELAEIAGEQRDWFYQYDNHNMNLVRAYMGLTLTGLYHPAILTTALTGTGLVDRDTAYDVVSLTRLWTEEDMTPWDASMSVYGALEAFFAEPDFSQGRITVHYATEASDEQFDTLLEQARRQ